jgi:hypothetical protein
MVQNFALGLLMKIVILKFSLIFLKISGRTAALQLLWKNNPCYVEHG